MQICQKMKTDIMSSICDVPLERFALLSFFRSTKSVRCNITFTFSVTSSFFLKKKKKTRVSLSGVLIFVLFFSQFVNVFSKRLK